jgi:hypothetical protein
VFSVDVGGSKTISEDNVRIVPLCSGSFVVGGGEENKVQGVRTIPEPLYSRIG